MGSVAGRVAGGVAVVGLATAAADDIFQAAMVRALPQGGNGVVGKEAEVALATEQARVENLEAMAAREAMVAPTASCSGTDWDHILGKAGRYSPRSPQWRHLRPTWWRDDLHLCRPDTPLPLGRVWPRIFP